MIQLRKQHPVFGLGTFERPRRLQPRRCSSYVRERRRRHRAVRQQPVPLPAAGRARPAPFEGCHPVELLGGVPLPAIGELPYLLTLAGARTRRCSPASSPTPRSPSARTALMKVFRKVTPGANPDIESTRCSPAGSDHVAALYGWLDWTRPTRRDDRPAGDAAAVPAHGQRRLGPGPGQRAQPVRRGRPARRRGRRRLRRRVRAAGQALAEVHEVLAEHFPTESSPTSGRARRRDAGPARRALGQVPELAPYADRLRPRLDAVADARRPSAYRRSGSTATSTSARPCAP
jgi:hypothetical protein